jgi:hypothetical protein
MLMWLFDESLSLRQRKLTAKAFKMTLKGNEILAL